MLVLLALNGNLTLYLPVFFSVIAFQYYLRLLLSVALLLTCLSLRIKAGRSTAPSYCCYFGRDHHNNKATSSSAPEVTWEMSSGDESTKNATAADPTKSLEQLRNSRKAFKGWITRNIDNLERHIAEEDVDSVNKCLQKLRASYDGFEDAHYKYDEQFTEDNDHDENEKYIQDVKKTYIRSVGDARKWLKGLSIVTQLAPNISKPVTLLGTGPSVMTVPAIAATSVSSASTVPVTSTTATGNLLVNPSSGNAQQGAANLSSQKDDLISMLSSIPRIEITKFSGNPMDYDTFMATFDELIDSRTSDSQIKLTRLLQYTEGIAHQSLKYTALIGGTEGYRQAREILKERYGNKYVVSQKIISNLKDGPSVSKTNDMVMLADEIKAGHTALESLGMTGEIKSQQCIQDILTRFPNYVRNKWKKHSLKHKKSQTTYPSFENFVKFILDVADDASDPIYGNKCGGAPVKSFNVLVSDTAVSDEAQSDSDETQSDSDEAHPSGVSL